MAKKKVAKVNVVKDAKQTWAVRLEFDAADHERLEHVARSLRLSKAAFARMAVVDRIRAEEARVKE